MENDVSMEYGILSEESSFPEVTNNIDYCLFVGEESHSRFYRERVDTLKYGDSLYFADSNWDYEYVGRYDLSKDQFEEILRSPEPDPKKNGERERFYPSMLQLHSGNLVAVSVNYASYAPYYEPFNEMLYKHNYDRVYIIDPDTFLIRQDWIIQKGSGFYMRTQKPQSLTTSRKSISVPWKIGV